jgi:hypothetical protein
MERQVTNNDDEIFKFMHGGEKLSRCERRQIKKLHTKVSKITQADRKYFERFPGRRHRIRFAGRAEVALADMTDPRAPVPQPGQHCYAVIRNVEAGKRMRFCFYSSYAYEDCDEATAAEMFQEIAERNGRGRVESIEQGLISIGKNEEG